MLKADVRILIIDDQPGIRRLLTEVLTEEGYFVATAVNGIEGVSKAQEIKPALILLDMKMPGMDGIETLWEIKRFSQGEKVVMMTAYGELDLINQAHELGAYGYVTKPFDVLNLCRMIENIVSEPQAQQLLIG